MMKRKLSFLFLSQLLMVAAVSAQHTAPVRNTVERDGMDGPIIGGIFLGLLLLFIARKLYLNTVKKKSEATAKVSGEAVEVKSNASSGNQKGEVFAAIAMAIYAATEEVHDAENTVLTIRRVERTYSPWSSKIYGLRDLPKR